MSAAFAKAVGLKPLDKPVTDKSGRPLPGKPRTNKAAQRPTTPPVSAPSAAVPVSAESATAQKQES